MKKALTILAILGLFTLTACAAMTGNSGEGGNKLKKSPCASLSYEGKRDA